jgi:hypothetical protein
MMHIADESQKKKKHTREVNDYVSGICLVENIHRPDRYCNIYDDIEYNQVTYTGQDPISRQELCSMNPLLVEALDIILFKGKTHQKRCKYITELNDVFLHKVKNINANGDVLPPSANDEEFLLPSQELRELNVKQSILEIFQTKSFAKTAHLRVAPSLPPQQQEEEQPALQELVDMLGDDIMSMYDDVGDYVCVNEPVPEVCCPEEFLDENSCGKRSLCDEEEYDQEEYDEELISLLLEYRADDFEPPLKRHETVLYQGCEIDVITV